MSRLISCSISIVIALLMLVSAGCSKSTPAADISAFTEYDITDLQGTEVQHADKNVKAGEINEKGFILNGKKTGMWVTYYPDGRIQSMRNYFDGKLYGQEIDLDKRGQLTEVKSYTDDQLDGMHITYRFGRPQEEIPYKMGVVDGKVMRYHTNGKLKEAIEYLDGKQHGYYRHFNEEGQKDMEYTYSHGEKVSGGIVEPEETDE